MATRSPLKSVSTLAYQVPGPLRTLTLPVATAANAEPADSTANTAPTPRAFIRFVDMTSFLFSPLAPITGGAGSLFRFCGGSKLSQLDALSQTRQLEVINPAPG